MASKISFLKNSPKTEPSFEMIGNGKKEVRFQTIRFGPVEAFDVKKLEYFVKRSQIFLFQKQPSFPICKQY